MTIKLNNLLKCFLVVFIKISTTSKVVKYISVEILFLDKLKVIAYIAF